MLLQFSEICSRLLNKGFHLRALQAQSFRPRLDNRRLISDVFFLDCVNEAYGLASKKTDLPEDGSDMIATKVITTLKQRHGRTLDKKLVLTKIMDKFDTWAKLSNLLKGTVANSEKLFKKINTAFDIT